MSLDLRNPPPWLATVLLAPDDTEESVLGSDLHQETISESHATLFEYAESLGAEGAPAWYVSSQVTILVALSGRDEPWRPKPDLFVVPGVPARSRTAYDTRAEGPMPPFVLEVASESTWRYDVEGKATLYNLAGVREYLVFDPAAAFLGEQVRAWRHTAGRWEPWHPAQGADGQQRWESRVLGLGIQPEGLLLRFIHPERGALPVRRELRERLALERNARLAAEERAQREQERAQREQAARQAAEERIARLEEELRIARADTERRRDGG